MCYINIYLTVKFFSIFVCDTGEITDNFENDL